MPNVGVAMKAAIERFAEHQRLSPRGLYLGMWCQYSTPVGERARNGIPPDGFVSPGLLLRAEFPARSPGDGGLTERLILWEELDARADDLVTIVDEFVAEALRKAGLEAPKA